MSNSDFLDLEPLLRARLILKIPSLHGLVLGVRRLGDLYEGIPETPAIYVAYEKTSIPWNDSTRAQGGTEQIIDQIWLVILAVQEVAERIGDRDGANSESGPLLAAIISSLLGWVPGPTFGPMSLVESPEANVRDDGLTIYPFRFSCRMVIKGEG